MPRLLHLDSSADPRTSRSRAITATFADAWRAVSPDHAVTYRDLHADPLPHLPDASLHWPRTGAAPSAPRFAAAETLQEQLIGELMAADAVVVGAPMYNFTVPSTLKAWLDYIHVPGVTTVDSPGRPLAGRPAVVATARGAAYPAGSAEARRDHVTPVLEIILGDSLGMDVSVISADLTLADTVPELAEFRAEAHQQLTDAHRTAERLAQQIGGRH
jgi:FMN-dependent NADH-azoreductase